MFTENGAFFDWTVPPDETMKESFSSAFPESFAVVNGGANISLLASGLYHIRAQFTVVQLRYSQYFSFFLWLSEPEGTSGFGAMSQNGLTKTNWTEKMLASCHGGWISPSMQGQKGEF